MMRYGFVIGLALAAISLCVPVLIAQDATPTAIVPVGTPDNLAEELVDLTTETAQATAATLDEFLTRLVQTPKSDVARVLLIGGGLILLVAGWRIYEIIILIAGFVMGASIASALVVTDSVLINTAVLLLGGIIGAVLSAFLYYIAVFLIGAYIGMALTNGLAVMLGLIPVSAIALLLGGLVGGIVLVGLSFEFLIVLSALVGAQMLTLGLGLDAIWTLILAVIGVIVQLGLTRSLGYEFRRSPRRINLFRRVTS
jgi:hypothetical protein